MNQLESLDFDFTQFLKLPKPELKKCGCGEMSPHVPCFTCNEKARADSATRQAIRIRDASIPPRFRGLTEDLVFARTMKRPSQITGWNPNKSMTFMGTAGKGKTTLAVWALMQHSTPGAMFVQACELELACRAQPYGSTCRLFEQCMNAPALVVDELCLLGGPMGNLCHLVDTRHNRMAPTFITSGLPKDTIATAYGTGFYRRAFHPDIAQVVTL